MSEVKEAKPKTIKTPGPDHPITIERNSNRVVVKLAGSIIADTRDALTLREASYAPFQYIPRKDVDMTLLERTDHATYCPYKGIRRPKIWQTLLLRFEVSTPNGDAAMRTNTNFVPVSQHARRLPHDMSRSGAATADASFEFGHFRVLVRRRQLLADGVQVEVGARAFDILVTLLEADGRLVAKEELFSRVWPGIVVSEENLKVQVAALRRALGADRGLIRTEYGRGYRFTGMLQAKAEPRVCQRRTPVEPRSRNWRQPLRCGFCWS